MKGIGIDLLCMKRFAEFVNRRGIEKVAKRILSSSEIETLNEEKDKINFLATRFSVKEAAYKAFYPKELTWKDISVVKRNGKPFLLLDGQEYCVSISHESNFMVSVVAYF